MSSEQREHLRPVKWLFGSQLLSRARQLAMSAVYGDKVDPTDWMEPTLIDQSRPPGAEQADFWFDYLSDTGDGTAATYSVAYLALSDLAVSSEQPRAGEAVSFDRGTFLLKRGAFLLVGGDTAYHVADVPTLGERFLKPFKWAYEDVSRRTGRALDDRLILGIPGNHDYYDALDGFNRVFRKPIEGTERDYNHIHGFYRAQQSTFAAVELPFDWWLLALDAQRGKIDGRQRAFFKRLIEERKLKRLVLATPEPSTVFGRIAPPGAELAKTLEELGLSRPFHNRGAAEEACRLDLSGDVHHYARYWGPAANGNASAEASPHYASIVAGLGGAFLHPSHTSFGEIAPQALYPPPQESRKRVARRTLNAWRISRGGGVGVIGALIAGVVYFAASVPETTQFGTELTSEKLLWLRHHVFGLAGRSAPSVFSNSLGFSICAALSIVAAACAVKLRDKSSKTQRKHGAEAADAEPPQRVPIARRTILRLAMGLAWGLALLGPYFGLWAFGTHSAAVLTSDVIAVSVVALCLVGLPFAGAFVGGARHDARGKLGFALLGLLHGAFQLGVPYLLVSRASLSSVLAASVVAVGVQYSMYWLARIGSRWPLALLFALHGCAQLALPILLGAKHSATLLGFGVAAISGLVTSCVFFGEYLTVALAFNGHNNEAGGAARIERFKLFIRCRLFKREAAANASLGVYVIGVDEPKQDGSQLTPKLIDYFELA